MTMTNRLRGMKKREQGSGADTIIRTFENAVSLWQKDVRLLNGTHRFEAINVGGVVLLVQEYPRGEGWEVFAPVCDEGRVDATLKAIAERTKQPMLEQETP